MVACDFFEAMEQLRGGKRVRSVDGMVGTRYYGLGKNGLPIVDRTWIVTADENPAGFLSREVAGQWEYFEPADGGAA